MTRSIESVSEAVFKLLIDGGTNALVAGRIYHVTAPNGAVLPHVIIESPKRLPVDTFGCDGEDDSFTCPISCYDERENPEGSLPLKRIMDAIRVDLEGKTTPVGSMYQDDIETVGPLAVDTRLEAELTFELI